MQKQGNKKGIIIGAVILVLLIAIFGVVFFFNRPKTSEGEKTIEIEVTGSDGETTEYDLNTDAEFLKEAMDELSENGSGFSYSGSDSEYGIMIAPSL